MAERIGYKSNKEHALLDIASELAKVDVERAITIADEIDDLSEKVSALTTIARMLLDGEAAA